MLEKEISIQEKEQESPESTGAVEAIEEKVFQILKKQIEESSESFEKWRSVDKLGINARKSRKVFDYLTAAKPELESGKSDQVIKAFEQKFGFNKTDLDNLRIDQFLSLLQAESLETAKPDVKPEVNKLYNSLKEIETEQGRVNALELLTSQDIDLAVKKDWLINQVLPRLDFLAYKDRHEAKKLPPPEELPQPEQLDKQPDILPPADSETMPVLEEHAEKKEGEPNVYFTITPFYGGYWRTQTFDSYDSKTKQWHNESESEWQTRKQVEADEKSIRVMQGLIRGGTTKRLSLPYNFAFLPETLKLPKDIEVKLLEDGEGNYLIDAAQVKQPAVPFSIELGKLIEKRTSKPPIKQLKIETGRLSKEIEDLIEELKGDNSLSNIQKARKLKYYVKGNLKYSTDYSYKNLQEVEGQEADCKTANTFAAGPISRLDIPVRMAGGHYIKVKDNKGRALITDSTGHAWLEVWDDQVNDWLPIDAAPEDADYMDKGEMDEKQEDKDFEGDFGEQEAEIIPEEKIKELIDEAKKRIAEVEKNKQAREKPEINFAKEAGCTEQEAKEILNQIRQARELKDKKGRNILNLLAQEFQKIIRANLKKVPAYRSPVKMSEGDELENPLEAYIDIKTGLADPGGWKKREVKIERVQEYGGFDVIVVVDKSGSMKESDPETGQIKYKEQQKFVFLVQDALYKFARDAKINKIKLLNPLDVRTCLISFRKDSAKIELPLSDSWEPKEQYKVWKSLGENVGGGTPDHLGLGLAEEIIKQDTKQSKEIKENKIIVEGVGLTESAKEIEATYYPNGKCLKSAAEAPEWAASRIIENAKKLYPEKVDPVKSRYQKQQLKKRLRLVIVTADGGSDNPNGDDVQQAIARLKEL